MRFFAINATGKTVHVRLDRNAEDSLVLTVSVRKLEDRRRPISTYVLVTNMPVHIAYLDDRTACGLLNPEGLKLQTFIDNDKDMILKIIGFVN